MAMNAVRAAERMADLMAGLMTPRPTGAALQQMRDGCIAITQALIEEIQLHGRARISTTASGLQRDPATSDPTLAPASDVFLPIE